MYSSLTLTPGGSKRSEKTREQSSRQGYKAISLFKLFLRLKRHGVENRRRFSESKIGTDFRNVCHAKTTPIFNSENRRRFSTPIKTCSISRSTLGSTWSIETAVIGWSSLFSFGLFVNSGKSVNIHCTFRLRFLLFVTILGSNSIVVLLFRLCQFSESKIGVYFWGRKSVCFWGCYYLICHFDENIRKFLNRILCTADTVSAEFQSCLMWERRPVSLMQLPSRFRKRWWRYICSDNY